MRVEKVNFNFVIGVKSHSSANGRIFYISKQICECMNIKDIFEISPNLLLQISNFKHSFNAI